jgi:hypothetical protein
MTARTVVAWVVAAVLGLALAAGVTLAASQLSSQRIGLSGEPLSAGDELVPRTTATPGAGAEHTDDRAPTATQPARRASPSGQPSRGGAAKPGDERTEAHDGDD